MNQTIKLSIILVIILGIIYSWVWFIGEYNKGAEVKECYDKKGNEIIGAKCIDDKMTYLVGALLTTLVGFGLIMALISGSIVDM